MYDSIVKPIEFLAASVFDGVAELLGHNGNDLKAPVARDVSLPQDLYARPDVQTEWWYYTGHCETESGRIYGFEFVFFKRRTDLDRIGIVPISLIANPMYAAHFALTDITMQRFEYEHKRSFGSPFDLPALMSETAYDLKLGDWTIREVNGKHVLHATLGDDVVFDAVLDNVKPLVLNGDDGNGISRKSSGASHHFSFTRMEVAGQITHGMSSEGLKGTAWMDREFGVWEQTNWDWFSIQFDDGTELMIYQYRVETGEASGDSTGTFVDIDGTCTYLRREDFEIENTQVWKSENTGTEYPCGWRITVPSLKIELAVDPLILDQELDTRGTTMVVYWEGACAVTGKRAGKKANGKAYVELVGYDRSHEDMSFSTFLFGDPLKRLANLF